METNAITYEQIEKALNEINLYLNVSTTRDQEKEKWDFFIQAKCLGSIKNAVFNEPTGSSSIAERSDISPDEALGKLIKLMLKKEIWVKEVGSGNNYNYGYQLDEKTVTFTERKLKREELSRDFY